MLLNNRRTVFISGSAYEYGHFGDSGKTFIRNLTKNLLKSNFSIISGYGLGIGSAVIESAMEEIYLGKKEPIQDHLQVYPWPVTSRSEDIKDSYRQDMIARAGVAIFVFGNKLEGIAISEADGMRREFEIARANGALLIPVGASGYVSFKLWQEMMDHFDEYPDSREKFELYQQLGAPYTRHDRLIELIIQIAQ
jgi:hypothetical protein